MRGKTRWMSEMTSSSSVIAHKGNINFNLWDSATVKVVSEFDMKIKYRYIMVLYYVFFFLTMIFKFTR
ncbi:hypothetical protein EUGRSUZ_G00537 [Eucalyptus grandis]|uniref:Uncharacterized protein n=2 Tax=Eucalyptus grandis TaxID=71139 RepID=A0ACC3K1G9_EUCGR|nr:hypothetical protein EUGRSUZ_G00537 [Eucalyptus grandis]